MFLLGFRAIDLERVHWMTKIDRTGKSEHSHRRNKQIGN